MTDTIVVAPHIATGQEVAFDVREVTYRYTAGVTALDGISLSIPNRRRVAILGANGSGKSTLLRLLDGLYFPDRGDIAAAYSWLPTLDQLRKNGKDLITSRQLAKDGKPTLDLGAVSDEFASAHPVNSVHRTMKSFSEPSFTSQFPDVYGCPTLAMPILLPLADGLTID